MSRRRALSALLMAMLAVWPLAGRRAYPAAQGRHPRHGGHRPDRLRGLPGRGFQGPHPWRPPEHHRPQPEPDPRAARRRPAGDHRRDRRDERQPGLRRRPADWRRLLLARTVLARGRSRASPRSTRWWTPPRPAARRPSTAQARLELPVTSASLAATLQRVFDRTSPFARSPNDVSFSGRSASSWSGAELGAMLQPIATPLVLSGFSGDTAVDLRQRVRAERLPACGWRGRRVGERDRRAGKRRACAGRSDRRRPRGRRPLARCHGHGHQRRRQPRLRVRPSLLQPRADDLPDDPGLRARRPAEPDVVVEDRLARPHRRHRRAGSRDGHCRHARPRPVDAAGAPGARDRSRAASRVQVHDRPRPAVHAAADLPVSGQHAEVCTSASSARRASR